MALKAFEIPKKKKINRKRLDSIINQYVDDTKFVIEIPSEDGKTSTIEFKRFIPAVEHKVFRNDVGDAGIIRDGQSGGMLIDPCGLELSVHAFIFQALSTLPIPTTEVDGKDMIDVATIGIYGAYFLSTSSEYRAIFENLFDEGMEVVEAKLKNYDRMMDSVLASFGMNEALNQQANVAADRVLNGADKTSAAQDELPDNVTPIRPTDKD